MKKLLDITEIMGKAKLNKEINISLAKAADGRYEIKVSKSLQVGEKIDQHETSIYLRLDEMQIFATNLLKVVKDLKFMRAEDFYNILEKDIKNATN